jgi:hypothetical protein
MKFSYSEYANAATHAAHGRKPRSRWNYLSLARHRLLVFARGAKAVLVSVVAVVALFEGALDAILDAAVAAERPDLAAPGAATVTRGGVAHTEVAFLERGVDLPVASARR